MSLPKSQRQYMLGNLLSQHQVASQEQAVSLMEAKGVKVTQATISRDLVEIGAVRVKTAAGVEMYVLPDAPRDRRPSDQSLRRILEDHVISTGSSGNVCIVTTAEGGARLVARALDRAKVQGVLGTIAGSDTVMVLAAEGSSGAEVAETIGGLQGGQPLD